MDVQVELPVFDRRSAGERGSMTRIGAGAIGGKASGLALILERILPALDMEAFPYFSVEVPTMTVLTTEVFDAFMDEGDLWPAAMSGEPDDRIAHAFQRAPLPAQYVGDLRALVAGMHTPVAVRSSSLLEDDLDHPFAGVYATKMIPNNEIEADARFRRLAEAIRFVYASTFFREARAYMRSVGRTCDQEKMAVILQEVVGRRVGDRFYPHVSGVGRSYNYYPTGHAGPSDGVVTLALGLGKTIVDGGMAWTYSPAYPKAPPPFNDIGDLLKNTQTRFWAVNMGPPPVPDPIRETECMVESGLTDAEADGSLAHLVSTYDPGSDRLNPGLGGRGARALTFAPLLGSRLVPFNDLLRRLLEVSEEALGTAVEIELAVDLHPTDLLPARVGFLQVRPMMLSEGTVEVSREEMAGDDVLLASEIVLGNGRRTDIADVVYVRPEAFDPFKTHQIAAELARLDESLADEGRHYLLIGFGRWGTSDPTFGIPVVWGQIANARVVVEATLPGVNPDLSQGSHFFHNVLSFRILYISVEHGGPYAIDWAWLDGLPAVVETDHVRHVRTATPLQIRVDGAHRRGVITHHD
jgi:hypothetical protein